MRNAKADVDAMHPTLLLRGGRNILRPYCNAFGLSDFRQGHSQ